MSKRFPVGLTLEQQRARAIECRYCGMLVFWNEFAKHPVTHKPMLCDAINGAPEYKQNHNCAIWHNMRSKSVKEKKKGRGEVLVCFCVLV